METKDMDQIVYEYRLTTPLGKGGFGDIFIAYKTNDPPDNRQLFAAKKIKIKEKATKMAEKEAKEAEAKGKEMSEETFKKVVEFYEKTLKKYLCSEILILKKFSGKELNSEEIRILKNLSGEEMIPNFTPVEPHPNIIKYYDLKQTKNSFYLITELANGGDLDTALKKYKDKFSRPFEEKIVQHFMRQICNAIKYIHDNHIIHRDLKLENCLIHYPNDEDKENMNLMGAQVKLIDFGISKDSNQGEAAKTFLGTVPNMAPTILGICDGKPSGSSYSNEVDIWSLGTLFYEMIIGELPFGTRMKEVVEKINDGILCFDANTISEEAYFFMKAMLKLKGEKRKTISELLNMPFLTKEM